MPIKVKSLVGRRFGRLVVLKREGSYLNALGKPNGTTWLCKCDCGQEKIATRPVLMKNECRSCGCLKRDTTISRQTKEGTAKRRVFYHYGYQAKIRNFEFKLLPEYFLNLIVQPCVYCGRVQMATETAKSGETFTYTGIDRVDSSKGYVLGNVVSCCLWCNRSKSDLTSEEFILNCKLVASQNP